MHQENLDKLIVDLKKKKDFNWGDPENCLASLVPKLHDSYRQNLMEFLGISFVEASEPFFIKYGKLPNIQA